jgi:uncharacterized protein YlaN (UPF0358 family)
MGKKKNSILALAKRNSLDNIINDEEEYFRVWKQIVPDFGFPKFIYNIVNVTENQLTFPYKGTVVEILDTNKHGVTEKVNFSDSTVTVIVDGRSSRFAYEAVRRLNHEDTDEFFYFFPDNWFKVDLPDRSTPGKLSSYDMKRKTAILNFNGTLLTLQRDEISRIL